MFSLGMTMLYLVYDGSIAELNLEINKPKLFEILNLVKFEWLKILLFKMLEFDYNQRPSLEKLIIKSSDASITLLN